MKIVRFLTIIVFATVFLSIIWFAGNKGNKQSPNQIITGDDNMYKKLTPEEERVIVYKGTEPPFSGKYNNFSENGLYICKRCGFPLFESNAKFKSECGWPSFDEQITGAVISQRDADGVRTENLCANCGAHLGHVFTGEGYTEKNTRFCINSVSMDFVPKGQRAIFSGGCFWGVQYYFKNVPGVISTTVGYTGGKTERPTYEQVCSGKTGHAEAIEVVFDPNMKIWQSCSSRYTILLS
jgi:peptide methionine sulfoxide reductase msrA/msrB